MKFVARYHGPVFIAGAVCIAVNWRGSDHSGSPESPWWSLAC